MILISASPSPFARKVRMALIEKGIAFTVQNEVPWHADSSTPRYNPLEQLPVLIPETGDPIFESSYILDWLEVKYPTPAMLPDDADAALEARLIHTISEGVADATVLLFWEMQREQISPEWARRQLRKVKGGLAELDRRAGDRALMVGDRFGLADIAVIALLGLQDTAIETGMIPAWQRFAPDMAEWRTLYPNLTRFEARHRDRPSVRETAPFMFELAEKIV